MWLFLPFGFYSIVFKLPTVDVPLHLFDKDMHEKDHSVLSSSDPYAHNFLCIRSRDIKSLQNLISEIKKYRPFLRDIDVIYSDIIDDQGTDYQYRMWIERHVISFYVENYLIDLEVTNFKSSCMQPYKNVFSEVWNTMWDLVERKMPKFSWNNFMANDVKPVKFQDYLLEEDFYGYEEDSDER